jgi:uncharacterized protein (DUF1810 family)
MADDLKRFIEAQDQIYGQALGELRQGRKRTHWMWFIFPQIAGLGNSPTAQYYAIADRAEAEAYLADEILGPRLLECCRAVNAHDELTANQIFGHPDDLKFRSSLTLFRAVAADKTEFDLALRKYYGGEPDPATLRRL